MGCRALRVLLVLVLTLVNLVACSPPWGDTSSAVDTTTCLAGLVGPDFASEGVFVEPTDGVAPVINELDHARCTIDVGIYLLTNEDVITALERAAGRGVRVRVIVERYPFGGSTDTTALASRLDAAGIEARPMFPSQSRLLGLGAPPPVSADVDARVLCFPTGSGLLVPDVAERVAAVVARWAA